MTDIDIPKLTVTEVEVAPLPPIAKLLQVRHGKVTALGNERSGIFKKEQLGRVLVSTTGIVGDEHVYPIHGGFDRALHQYCVDHYPVWKQEAPEPDLFEPGGFGENLVATGLSEDNVCIGDLFGIGEIVVQVSEPRSPCYKLNMRFKWKRALKRISRRGWVGWNFRVLQAGYIESGDEMRLIKRPHPQWSIMNMKKVMGGKASIELLREVAELPEITGMPRDACWAKVDSTMKTYTLIDAEMVSSRVRQLTFKLRDYDLPRPFVDFAWAQIEFAGFKRSYSIVSGDMNQFTLGISLDDHSRGGSAYLHKMQLGEELQMCPGAKEETDEYVGLRIIIIGGIGVTAFLPSVKKWQAAGLPFQVHYAVRDPKDVAYLDLLPVDTKVYSRPNRLDVNKVIPKEAKVYACGPTALMNAVQGRCEDLGYTEDRTHFESFSADVGERGDPFDVQVKDTISGRTADLTVPSDKSLLQVLRGAGFDMTYFCEAGACGACKVTHCKGEIIHKPGTNLQKWEKDTEMLSCVDRGVGKINIELD